MIRLDFGVDEMPFVWTLHLFAIEMIAWLFRETIDFRANDSVFIVIMPLSKH